MPKPDLSDHFAKQVQQAKQELAARNKDYEDTKKRYEDPRGPSRTEPYFNETLEKKKAAAELAKQQLEAWERRQKGEALPGVEPVKVKGQ